MTTTDKRHAAAVYRDERHAVNLAEANAVRQGQKQAQEALAPALRTMGKPQRGADPAKILNKAPRARRDDATDRTVAPATDLLKG